MNEWAIYDLMPARIRKELDMSAGVASRVLDLVVGALATYRLTKLVNDDYITQPLRDKVVKHFGEPDESKITYLVHCPWCVSIYTGGLVSTALMMYPDNRVVRVATTAFAFSALTGIMAEREDSF
jgi:hypothetical protein